MHIHHVQNSIQFIICLVFTTLARLKLVFVIEWSRYSQLKVFLSKEMMGVLIYLLNFNFFFLFYYSLQTTQTNN
jgi:hypothetical protein